MAAVVINPQTLTKPHAVLGGFDPVKNTGVVPLNACSPNGSSVGPDDNVILGCTPGNNPSDIITLVINAKTKAQTPIANITGSDEVWYNGGDHRYYTGSSKMIGGAVLGVIDAETNLLIETIPQSANSHSVAAEFSRLNTYLRSPSGARCQWLVPVEILRPWCAEICAHH